MRTRYRTSRTPVNIAQNTLYHVLENGIATQPLCMVSRKFHRYGKATVNNNITEHSIYSRVVHPVTKESITSLKKLMADPITRIIQRKTICLELGRLAQGYRDTPGTNTICFITDDMIQNITVDRTITYTRVVVDYRPHKEDPNQVRINVGVNMMDYPKELTTRTSDITTTKIMWNSILSTPGAKYMCTDIKNMYLATPMECFKYM